MGTSKNGVSAGAGGVCEESRGGLRLLDSEYGDSDFSHLPHFVFIQGDPFSELSWLKTRAKPYFSELGVAKDSSGVR